MPKQKKFNADSEAESIVNTIEEDHADLPKPEWKALLEELISRLRADLDCVNDEMEGD